MSDTLKLIIFGAVVFAAAFASSYIFPLPLLLLLLLSFYFTGFTFILNAALQKALADANKNKFTQLFMGLTGIKMLSSIILLIMFLYFFKDNRLHTGVCIMVFYMLYTIFEVVLWTRKLKPKV